MHDLRYALRLIRRQPMFAAVVITTLTLGIGASTGLFSVVNGVLLKPLPYSDPAGLVWMYGAFRSSDSAAVSPPDFLDYRARNASFERLGAMEISPSGVTVIASGTPERRQASRVSAGLITTLGIAPALGRDFAPADESAGSPAVIISHRLSQQLYGGAPGALGQPLAVDDRALTIVGVMPPDFALPYDSFIRLTEPVDLYLPIPFDEPDAQIRRFHSLRLIGRLKPSVSLEQAQADMNVIARQLEATYPENETWHLRLVPLEERIVGGVRPVLLLLMSAVTLLLLMACANVASLLLARASTRENELAVRGALGASRGRIIRQQLVEGFVFSLVGGIGALALTWWTIEALRHFGPSQFPRLQAVTLDYRVVAYAFGAAAATTIVFALAPAVHAARRNLAAAITSLRTSTDDRAARRGQRALVVAQLAIAMVLLAAAALLVRGFVRLTSTETGFNAAGVMLTRVPLPEGRYDTDAKVDAHHSQLLERLARTPGIDAAALGTAPPLAGANDTIVYREGRRPATTADQRFAQIRWIQGDYFRALDIDFSGGRAFDQDLDRRGAPAVAIISRRAARDHFGRENPLGEHLVVDLREPEAVQVIGIVDDVRTFGQANEAPPMVYLHARQHPARWMQVIVKSTAPDSVEPAIRRHVQALDPTLAMSRVERLEVLLSDSVAQPRFAMLLIATFATLALVIAIVGLYGTLTYMVSRRRREIGIRLAIGATGRDVRRMFIRQGASMIALGISFGIAASFVTSKFAASLVFAIEPASSLLLAGVAGGLGLVALLAVVIPASRASRVEPLGALRSE